MTDARVQAVVLTTGDRINRRLENFREMANNELQKDGKIDLQDFNSIIMAIEKMVVRETTDIVKRR